MPEVRGALPAGACWARFLRRITGGAFNPIGANIISPRRLLLAALFLTTSVFAYVPRRRGRKSRWLKMAWWAN